MIGDTATRRRRSPLVPAGAVMVLLSLVAGVINYASNLVFGRLLTPAEYGDLTALLALSVIASVPAFAAQTRIAERLTTHRTRGDLDTAAYSIRHGAAHVGVYALLLGAACLAASPLVEKILSLHAIGPAIALSPLLVVSFLTPLALGVLQGLERLIALGLFMVAIALSRLVVGTLWVETGGGSGGAVAGQALGTAAALVAIALLVKPQSASPGRGAATAGAKRKIDAPALSATGAFIAFALLSNLDVVLAKLALTPEGGGAYAALSTIGKIVLFLPSAVAVAMVPRAARRREEGNSASRELRIAALVTFAISAVAATAAFTSPGLVLSVMFGDQYDAAKGGVLPIVLAGTGLSLIYLLVVYTVAVQDRRWSTLLLVGVAVQIIAILQCNSPSQVATAQAAVIWGTLLVNEVLFHPLVVAERFAWRGRREARR
ncbi:MAG: hypothetical protein AAGC46_00655 [Solirubrobacteraceae bacterium]|nr:hypothetical protein [Patulibacter sp.]